MRPIFVDICEETPKIRIKLGTPGCLGKQVTCGNIWMEIHNSLCCEYPYYPLPFQCCTPCGGYYEWPMGFDFIRENHKETRLTYKALEIDDDGNVVFYFDHALFENPAGRYIGSLFLNGCKLRDLQINLCTIPIAVEQISTDSVRPCCTEIGV